MLWRLTVIGAIWILRTLLRGWPGFRFPLCLDLDFSAHSAPWFPLIIGLCFFATLCSLSCWPSPHGQLKKAKRKQPVFRRLHSGTSFSFPPGWTPKRFLGILVWMSCPDVASVHAVRHGPTLVPRDGLKEEVSLSCHRDVQSCRRPKSTVISCWLLLLVGLMALDELLMCAAPDVEALNILLEKYGRELFRSGRPYGHYSETLNAVSAKRPRLRRSLQPAWGLAYSWLRQEPPSHHLALPWQALLALLVTAWMWGWSRVAGVLALSWGGLTRIGEVLQATRQSLILPEDVGWTVKFAMLQISEPKTRFRTARHQVARLAGFSVCLKRFPSTVCLRTSAGRSTWAP